MTAKMASVEQRAHQTRYLISLEASETSLLSLRKLRPRVDPWRIAIPLTAQDLNDISFGDIDPRSASLRLPVYLVDGHQIECHQTCNLDLL